MATKFVTNLDLLQNQIINGRFEVVSSDPTTGNFEGRLIYNSTDKVIKVYDGTAWRVALHAISSATTALSASESAGTVTLTIADATTSDSGLLSATDKTKLDAATASNTASTLVLRDASGNFKASDPLADQDVATKYYVDAARAGLDVKQSVRVATTGNITLDNTTTSIDGITLADGDRVLVKNQSTGSQNGIYVASTSGSWSRATDADATGELTAGSFVFVEEGTDNADSGWVVTTDGTITIGSTSIAFAQFSGAGQITAGDGLTKTGNTLNVGGTTDRITVGADTVDIASTYVGQSSITTLGTISTGTWEATDVAVAHGGTGASTASDARSNLADTPTSGLNTSTPVLGRISARTIGDGSTLTYTVTHNFNTRDVVVQVFDTSTYDTVFADVLRSTVDAVEVTFSSAPALNAYRVVVTG